MKKIFNVSGDFGGCSKMLQNNMHLLSLLFVLVIAGSGYSYNWQWDQYHDVCYLNDDEYEDRSDDCGENMCCLSCPVYTGTGSYHAESEDITISGVGPKVSVMRRWTSTDPVVGAFGNG